MTVNHIAAVMRTNMSEKNIKGDDIKGHGRRDFLLEVTNFLGKEFSTDTKNVTVEVQTGVMMMRGSSGAPMMNIHLYHNCDKINQSTKVNIASTIAVQVAGLLEVPVDRVLVLFFDTRKCT